MSCAATIYTLTLVAVFGDSRDLPDDQSDQGELLDGADHDGLRAGGFSDGKRSLRPNDGRTGCLLLAALIGLLIGLSVNFRLPNVFLSAGYLSSSWSRF